MSAGPGQVGTISRVEFRCHRLRALRSFYGEHLGLPTVGDQDQVTVTAGTTEIVFRRAAEDQDGRYHFAFEVPESLVEDGQQWLERRTPVLRYEGSPLVTGSEAWNSHACYAFDPAGNVIELIGRHRLIDPALRPFGPQHLRRLSEVGIVAPDVTALAARLGRRLGLVPWAGEKSPTFTACGSELGLLIVVKTGRVWFPAGPPAAVSPLSVQLWGAKAGHLSDAKLGLELSIVEAPSAAMR